MKEMETPKALLAFHKLTSVSWSQAPSLMMILFPPFGLLLSQGPTNSCLSAYSRAPRIIPMVQPWHVLQQASHSGTHRPRHWPHTWTDSSDLSQGAPAWEIAHRLQKKAKLPRKVWMWAGPQNSKWSHNIYQSFSTFFHHPPLSSKEPF